MRPVTVLESFDSRRRLSFLRSGSTARLESEVEREGGRRGAERNLGASNH